MTCETAKTFNAIKRIDKAKVGELDVFAHQCCVAHLNIQVRHVVRKNGDLIRMDFFLIFFLQTRWMVSKIFDEFGNEGSGSRRRF
jgi:hypothetical protein